MRVLAFDIGIKNLAWCLMDSSEGVIDWCNYNIMNDISGAVASAAKCKCGSNAAWEYSTNNQLHASCKRHLPKDRPASNATTAGDLKALLKSNGQSVKGKKDELRERALECASLPLQKKITKTKSLGLMDIYDGIRKCIRDRASTMLTADAILLENQPAYKNPTMKTIQSFLFAALREASHTASKFPDIDLVHASQKVEYETKGDAGYAERKGNSEEKVLEHIKDPQWRDFFQKAKKRSDLADAYCMCLQWFLKGGVALRNNA
jgi:hypothetical protein